MGSPPAVSLIIPVHHDGPCLAEAVAAAAAARPPPGGREILVVGGETPPESALPLPEGCRHVPGPMRDFSRRLNLAAAAARGRVLAFVDDDCAIPADYFERLGELFDREGVGMIGGRDEFAGGASPFDLALDHVLNARFGLRGFRRPAGGDSAVYSPKLWNMAMTRSAADAAAVGGALFDEALVVHQDVELARRVRAAGVSVRYEPELVVRHRRETTLRLTTRRNFRMGRVARRTGVQRWPHRLVVAGTLMLPVILIGSVGAGLLALFRTRSARIAAMVPVILIALAVARSAGYVLPGGGQASSRQ